MQGDISAGHHDSARWTIVLLLACALAVGFYLRLEGMESDFIYGDEIPSLRTARMSYAKIIRTYDRRGSGLALPLIQRVAADVLGPSHWSYRLPALAGGLATLLLFYPIARRFAGAPAAALATLALSTSAMHVFYSRFGRSYGLVVLLSLGLVYGLQHLLVAERQKKRVLLLVALSCALLPYLHLTTIGLIAAVAAAAVAAMLLTGRPMREILWLLGAITAGLLVCAALYVPAWKPTWRYIGMMTAKEYSVEFGPVDITALVAGSRAGAWLLLLGVPAAAAAMLAARREKALVLVLAAIGPPLALLIIHPHGPYASARYMLSALPFMLILLSWLLVELFRRLPLPVGRRVDAALVLGVFLVAIAYATGPLSPSHTDDGPYGSMMFPRLMPLAPFDRPYSSSPGFYARLAAEEGPVRIIEAPELKGRRRFLYRNYYLQHGKETWLGFVFAPLKAVPRGPYVSLNEPQWVKESGADYLVLHLDLKNEISGYWDFIYGKERDRTDFGDITAYMSWHSWLRGRDPRKTPADLVARLRAALEEPVYEDSDIVVWRLAPGDRRP